eukprot:TRINITY_DN44238_c0_g1_i1.p1 TRINITY_DN44238_c0_g1~~TRINITY_DN44238_c0_g1_i1.p1  ORF type:complete len:319 (-),score=27.13 TRINITY_DN44238_c0_g1_i1:371-1222(-)
MFGGYLNEKHAKYIVLQIILDVQYISSQGFNFIDIEPSKILINIKNKADIQQHEVVLANQAKNWKYIPQKQKQLSRFWSKNAAPEVLTSEKQKKYDASFIDVWNIGVLAYYLTGGEPFASSSHAKRGQYQLPINFNLSVNCLDFLSKTLFAYPVHARTNLIGLQFLPWFKNSEIDTMKLISMQSRHNYLLRDNYQMNDLYNVINDCSDVSLSSILEGAEKNSMNSQRSSFSLKNSFTKFSDDIEKVLKNLQSEEKQQCSNNIMVNQLSDKNRKMSTCRVGVQI